MMVGPTQAYKAYNKKIKENNRNIGLSS